MCVYHLPVSVHVHTHKHIIPKNAACFTGKTHFTLLGIPRLFLCVAQVVLGLAQNNSEFVPFYCMLAWDPSQESMSQGPNGLKAADGCAIDAAIVGDAGPS